MRNFLIYAGKSTTDFNVWISGGGTYDAPERDVKKVSVPGRNGDLTMDNGRFENVTMKYPAFIPRNWKENMAAFRAYMKSFTGYQRLEDTYHPEVYYEAILTDSFDPDVFANKAGEFEITFDRKPQRWLKSGETFLPAISGSYVIYNPTLFEAKPLIRVRGTGTFYIGEIAVEVNQNSVYTDIDCEMQNCYYGLNNLNANVELLSGSFPTIPAGATGITLSGISSIEIKPRWWTL